MVIANFAALLNDDGVWDNPERFWPERFIGCDGKLIVPDEYLPFGYGNYFPSQIACEYTNDFLKRS